MVDTDSSPLSSKSLLFPDLLVLPVLLVPLDLRCAFAIDELSPTFLLIGHQKTAQRIFFDGRNLLGVFK